jgi:type IV secretion system protein VirB9
MNLKNKLALTGLLFLGFTLPALAEKFPQDGIADARVKVIAYHDNDVYKLKGHYGFTTIIEFGQHERIETISLGDSAAWQVSKLNRSNMLLIKPLEQNADTNMNVLTNQHIYTFQLAAEKASSPDADDLIFRLRFTYPDDRDAGITNYNSASEPSASSSSGPELTAKNLNFNYSYSGAKALQPERVFDDGKFTYFQFKTLDATPAVFLVDEKGNESLINFTTEGPYLVVERTGRQFTLRDGDIATCIFNEAYVRPTGKQGSPTPLGTIKPKKTAHKKSTNSPTPLSLSWFKSLTPIPANDVTYNR